MLRDAMCGVRAIMAHERGGGPTVFANDLTQACGICVVNGRHTRMIPLERRPVGSQLRAQSLVVFIHRDEFCSQRLVQYNAPLGVTTRSSCFTLRSATQTEASGGT